MTNVQIVSVRSIQTALKKADESSAIFGLKSLKNGDKLLTTNGALSKKDDKPPTTNGALSH
jgi:hypothetical protein